MFKRCVHWKIILSLKIFWIWFEWWNWSVRFSIACNFFFSLIKIYYHKFQHTSQPQDLKFSLRIMPASFFNHMKQKYKRATLTTTGTTYQNQTHITVCKKIGKVPNSRNQSLFLCFHFVLICHEEHSKLFCFGNDTDFHYLSTPANENWHIQ